MSAPGFCLHCKAPVPGGFATCGPECTNGTKPLPVGALFDELPAGLEVLSASQLSRELGCGTQNFYNWRASGKLKSFRAERGLVFDAAEARKLHADSPHIKRELVTPPPEPMPPLEQKRVAEVSNLLVRQSKDHPWMERALAAAKEAFRDVMLERADEAKSRGDHKERADALEDYLFFEEGLKLVYERKRRA